MSLDERLKWKCPVCGLEEYDNVLNPPPPPKPPMTWDEWQKRWEKIRDTAETPSERALVDAHIARVLADPERCKGVLKR
jgi:hypothetical protein